MLKRVGCLLFTLLAVSLASPATLTLRPAVAQTAGGRILAPARGQAAWLDLEGPRPRPVTQVDLPAYVTDVAAISGAPTAVLAVASPLGGGQSSIGSDLVSLDMTGGGLTALVQRADANESLGAPAWLPDESALLFQREDRSVPGLNYQGSSVVLYPARLEMVRPDGSGRTVLVEDARQPGPSPDNTRFVFLRTSSQGTALAERTYSDPSEQVLIVPGLFRDLASPRYSPQGDRIAFMAPQTSVGTSSPSLLANLFDGGTAFAHGFRWDMWAVGLDGSGARRLAAFGGDDATLAWSPDGSQLFVYGGAGSFIVDATTGEVTMILPYVAGYGAAAWLAP